MVVSAKTLPISGLLAGWGVGIVLGAAAWILPETPQLVGDGVGSLELPPVRATGERDEPRPGALGQARAEVRRRVGIPLAPEHEPRRGDAPQIAGPLGAHVYRRPVEGEDAA